MPVIAPVQADAKPRILYVDDDPDHRRLYSVMLRDEFDVTLASNGEAGLRALDQDGPFAVVLSDMRMPHMNGTDLLSRVRVQRSNVTRILLTGDADVQSAMQAVNEAQAFRYLTKPCRRADLLGQLHSAVQEHTRQQARDGIARRLEIASSVAPAAFAREAELCLGAVIADRYRTESVLGVGGTAVVFRCYDLVLGCEVALKLFPDKVDTGSQQRIRRELTLSRQLSHPNVLRYFDIGVHGNCLFITMELLRGRDLATVLERGKLPIDRSLDYMIQACRGLAHAHRFGITHRDVKPENLFLDDEGVLHVTDFGLAKQRGRGGITAPNTVAGTLRYMAPEQMSDFASASHLADIYALGAVGYELLTGRAPFEHRNMMALMTAHLNEVPAPATTLVPELHPHLDHILQITLAKDPAARFQNCGALASALEQVRTRLR